jgi:hypothetical protein
MDTTEDTTRANNQKYLADRGFDFNSVRPIPKGDHRTISAPFSVGFFIKDRDGVEHTMVFLKQHLPPAIANKLKIDPSVDPSEISSMESKILAEHAHLQPKKRKAPKAATKKAPAKKAAKKAAKKSKKK